MNAVGRKKYMYRPNRKGRGGWAVKNRGRGCSTAIGKNFPYSPPIMSGSLFMRGKKGSRSVSGRRTRRESLKERANNFRMKLKYFVSNHNIVDVSTKGI